MTVFAKQLFTLPKSKKYELHYGTTNFYMQKFISQSVKKITCCLKSA